MGATPAVGGISIVLSGDGQKFSKMLDDASKRLAKLRGETGDFGSKASEGFQRASAGAQQFGHTSVSSMQAASGALRELNGNFTNNIRAVERLITTLPGAATFLKAIFPLTGGLAFGGMIVEVGQKLATFIKETNEVPKKIQAAYRELHTSAALSNDDLRQSNDRLQNEILKLEGKPQNNLQVAIDDARKASDKLSQSLQENLKRSQELFKQYRVGVAAQLFMGKDSTASQEGSILSYRSQMADLGVQVQDATRSGDTKLAAQKQKELDDKNASYNEWLARDIAMRKGTVQIPGSGPVAYSAVHGDQTTALNIDFGEKTTQGDDADRKSEETRKALLDKQHLAIENAVKGAGDLLKAQESQLAKLKLQHDVTVKEEYQFWDARKNLFAAKSQEYNQVVSKQAELAMEAARAASEKIKRFVEEQKKGAEGGPAINESISKTFYDFGKEGYQAEGARIDAANQLLAVQAAANAKLAEAGVQDAAGKTMSEYAAATAQAVIHAKAFGVELDALMTKQRGIANDPYLNNVKRAEQLGPIAEQIAALQGARQLQVMQDAARTGDQSTNGLIGATDALNEFAASVRESAKQVHELVDSSLNDFNKTLVEELTTRSRQGPRHLWQHFGHDVATSATGSLLKKGEGTLLGAFGFGTHKADGSSAGSALWVRSASPMGSASGSANPFGSLFSGGAGAPAATDADTAGAGSFLSTLGPLASNIIPFMADGGDFNANSMAVVGERGPELVRFGRYGSVTSNDDLGRLGGGDTHHHYNIDARGASDPAQVQLAVQRGIQSSRPMLAADAHRFSEEVQRRKPSSRR